MMSADLSKLTVYTAENYLKRSEFCGSIDLTLPGYGGLVTHTVDHNLGYEPLFDVGVEFDEPGTIWAGGTKVNSLTDQMLLSGLFADEPYPELSADVTTTQLVIRLRNYTTPTATGTRRIYWVTYLDYSDA